MKALLLDAMPCPEPLNRHTRVPPAFCWTKMGAEAGQELSLILARKEAERQLGQGTFLWGIGNALGTKIWDFVDDVRKPTVLFTKLKSKPRSIDVSPRRVVAWTAFYDRHGFKQPMPPFAFVTSRTDTETRVNESRFALVCRSDTHLGGGVGIEPLLSEQVVNYKSKTRVAPSQVTALVELGSANSAVSRKYEVDFSAELVAPFYVKLADPVEIPKSVLAEINRIPLSEDFGAEKWRDYLNRRFEFRKSVSIQLGLLPAEPQAKKGAGSRRRRSGDEKSVVRVFTCQLAKSSI